MKPFSKKALLLSLTFLTLLSATFGRLPPTVSAQCPAGAEEPYCGDATAVCTSPSPVADTLFSGNSEICTAVTYEIARALFASPPPLPWYDPDPRTFAQKVFDPSNPDEIFGERYTYAQVRWILNSALTIMFPPLRAQSILDLMQMIIGIIEGINNATNAFDTQASIIKELPKYGFIGETYFLMAHIPDLIFTDKVASGMDEVKYMASKLNIASPTYAQGLGYDKLDLNTGTIRGFWIATRNIAYLIAVVILIVAGFMVIFRTKISAQASVTVQLIIPRLIITLVLVTFSFAIAGFVIDMMYVIISAVIGLLWFVQGLTGTTIFENEAGFRIALDQLTGDFGFLSHFLGMYIAIAILLLLLTIALAIIAAWATLGAAAVVAPLMGIILGFFMWSIYLWAKILGQLIVAYLSLILLVIAGPLMIIFDILPTSPGGFKKWITCVIGNASVFVSYAMLSIVLFVLFDNTTGTDTGFFNETGGTGTHIRSGFSVPLFSGGYPRTNFLIQYFLFIGFMSMIPNLVSSIQGMFCKEIGMGNFIENTVKDTIGQFTTAGQKAGEGMAEYRKDALVQKQIDARNAKNTPPASPGGTATGAGGG